MPNPFDPTLLDVNPLDLLLLVTGSGIEPETTDRATADELADAIRDRLSSDDPRRPLVVSDLWYLNQPAVSRAAAISIGRPEINAASALLARRIPTAIVVDGRFRVQFDVEGIEHRACVYGVDAHATRDAVRLFQDRHLGAWLEEAMSRDRPG